MEEMLPLTTAYNAARLQWASEKMTNQPKWNVVIVLEQKKFSFDGPDGSRFYWRDFCRPAQQDAWGQQGGGVGAISWEWKTELEIFEHRQVSSHFVYTIG